MPVKNPFQNVKHLKQDMHNLSCFYLWLNNILAKYFSFKKAQESELCCDE